MAVEKGEAPPEGLLGVFMQFHRRLAQVVGRIVRRDDIEDILQETFLRCYQASATTTVQSPRSFMLTTARNLALNHIALADNRLVGNVGAFDEGVVPLYLEQPAQSAFEGEEQFLHLCRAVNALPGQCRRAFVLKKVYGLSRKEIAAYMQISESTVQKHIARAVMLCAEYLEESEGSLSQSQRQRRRQNQGSRKQKSAR